MPEDLSHWLSKAQAAEAIGVSTKTIEKLAEAGAIQKQTWRRAGKPAIAVYHPDDIQRERKKRNPEAEAFVLPQDETSPPASTALVKSQATPEAFMAAFIESIRRPQDDIRLTERHYLTVKEASRLTGLTESYLMRKIKANELPAIKDVSWKIKRSDLEKL